MGVLRLVLRGVPEIARLPKTEMQRNFVLRAESRTVYCLWRQDQKIVIALGCKLSASNRLRTSLKTQENPSARSYPRPGDRVKSSSTELSRSAIAH